MIKRTHGYRALLVLLLIIAFGFSATAPAQSNIQLKFNNNHTFKIAQFTDLHWENNSPDRLKTAEVIKSVISAEKPDLIIVTGDIVTDIPAKEGWNAVSEIFAGAQIPWAITLGNHDRETGLTRNQIFGLLSGKPFFAGSLEKVKSGYGNYTLAIKSADGKKTAAVIYCIDSNDYPENSGLGTYDWIHFNQIKWYRETSDKFRKQNNNMPVPSLAFFHIPLIEYNDIVGKETTIGQKNEEVASAEINSGMFASMVEKQDVMGVFTGHDHVNNYCGIDHNVCLAYGCKTGFGSYGDLEHGGRIIELHEGEFSFNTWIRTPSGVSYSYNFPSGLKNDDSNVAYLPAKEVKGLKPGVSYKYYEGRFKTTDAIESSKVIKSGILKNISIENAAVPDSFAFVFNSYIKIPKKGFYRFYLNSDDGSKLFIDGRLVINNDGSHSAKRAEGILPLDEGFHEFKLLYFEDYAGNKLEVGFSSIAIRECTIPGEFFYTK